MGVKTLSSVCCIFWRFNDLGQKSLAHQLGLLLGFGQIFGLPPLPFDAKMFRRGYCFLGAQLRPCAQPPQLLWTPVGAQCLQKPPNQRPLLANLLQVTLAKQPTPFLLPLAWHCCPGEGAEWGGGGAWGGKRVWAHPQAGLFPSRFLGLNVNPAKPQEKGCLPVSQARS